MAGTIIGRTEWEGSRDAEGHRTWFVEYNIEVSDVGNDGPAVALATPGLPTIGSAYAFGNDSDPDAWCRPNADIKPYDVIEGNPVQFFKITFTFSTKPLPHSAQRCGDVPIGNPLLEPPKISGKSTRERVEATHDRFGFPIVNSAWEQVRGAQVEFDEVAGTITIEQNVATIYLAETLPELIASTAPLNMFPLWGRARRCIKLSEFDFDRKYYGFCGVYYTRRLTFESNAGGFDRELLDEGYKVLHGHWDNFNTGIYIVDEIGGEPANRFDPSHFNQAQDRKGNPIKIPLDGYGLPADAFVSNSSTSGVFISLTNGNIDNPLNVSTIDWVRMYFGDPMYWESGTTFHRGAVVFPNEDTTDATGSYYYVCIATHAGVVTPPTNPNWQKLNLGLVNKGQYSDLETYSEGDYVYDVIETNVGSIFVQKYDESDLLLLGIPAVL